MEIIIIQSDPAIEIIIIQSDPAMEIIIIQSDLATENIINSVTSCHGNNNYSDLAM